MITRFYADNYKCLVNFEYKPQPLELIIGANGSGKSTVFEALAALCDLIVKRASVNECFPASTLTRWQNSHIQTFQITLEVDDVYNEGKKEMLFYEALIEHDSMSRESRICRELLSNSSTDEYKPLFVFNQRKVELYWDDNPEGPKFPLGDSNSALAIVETGLDSQRIELFKQQLSDLLLIHLNPMAMDYATENDDSIPTASFSNFASWYRHQSQEQPASGLRVSRRLAQSFGQFRVSPIDFDRFG